MKRRLTALALLLAVLASACGVSALAKGAAQSPAKSAEEKARAAEQKQEETADTETEEPKPEVGTPPVEQSGTLAGPNLEDQITLEPDPVGQVTFANVESRMRQNNLQILTLEQSILSLEEIDYEELYEDLRQQLNQIAKTQWQLVNSRDTMIQLGMMSDYEYHSTYDQLDKAYDAVRDTFESIKEGDMQRDNADVIRQLNHLQDQIVMAGESLYIALTAMEIQAENLRRQDGALDRTVEELELRYRMGQISAMQLGEAKAGRTSLESGLATLEMNIGNYKVQLEMLLGAEQTGAIALGPVPEVTDGQLAELDLEKDLAAAKEKSYELYDAGKTVEQARDDYKDAGNNWGYNEEKYEFRNARRTWQAAQYTYNNTVQNYELKFRTLYAQVRDYRQILEAARVALSSQQDSYRASELKYQQGTISQNALLAAEDELRSKENAVISAQGDLFSAYNSYRWAVEHGILN